MIEKIYLDSNVFVSLVREEIDGNFRMLFKEVETALAICNKLNIKVVVSFLFFDEVKSACGLDKESTIEALQMHSNNIESIDAPMGEIQEWFNEMLNLTRKFGL